MNFNKRFLNNYKYFSNVKVDYTKVKYLRDLTGASLINCRNALGNNENDMDKAKIYLKEKNLILANKKSDRETKSGVIGTKMNLDSFLLLEINSETDFVAKNDNFLDFTDTMLESIKENLDKKEENSLRLEKDLNNILEDIFIGENNIKIEEKLITAKLQENVKISKLYYEKLKNKKIGIYTHKEYKTNIGLFKTLIHCEVNYDFNKTSEKRLNQILENLAVHCFSLKPEYIYINEYKELDSIKKEIIDTLPEKIKSKPEEMVNNIIEGKLKKVYQEKVMIEQNLGFEESNLTIKEYLDNLKVKENISIKINNYEILKI